VSPAATLTVAAGLASLGILPAFLLGSLASLVREDLGMTRAQVGLAISAFLLVYAIVCVPGGRAADRVGARRALGAACVVVVAVAAGIALMASTFLHVVLLLGVAGAAMGVADPTANMALSRGLNPARQGLAFALKESAGPGATLLAGLAVPTIALTLGWRWTFAACGLLVALLVLLLPWLPGGSAGSSDPAPGGAGTGATSAPRRLSGLVPVAVAGGFGTAAAIAMGAFFVESAANAGVELGMAGLLLSVGSVFGITGRLAMGWLADRRGVGFGTVALLLLGGALGSLALSASQVRPLLLIGTVLSFAAGWGWAALLIYAVVRAWRDMPGSATGVVVAGLTLGAAIGPAVFGWVSSHVSFAVAWYVNAALAVTSAALVARARATERSWTTTPVP
jgi:MFS family permease